MYVCMYVCMMPPCLSAHYKFFEGLMGGMDVLDRLKVPCAEEEEWWLSPPPPPAPPPSAGGLMALDDVVLFVLPPKGLPALFAPSGPCHIAPHIYQTENDETHPSTHKRERVACLTPWSDWDKPPDIALLLKSIEDEFFFFPNPTNPPPPLAGAPPTPDTSPDPPPPAFCAFLSAILLSLSFCFSWRSISSRAWSNTWSRIGIGG